MSGANGTAVLPRLSKVIELGDLSPETTMLAVVRDGERVELTVYVNSDRTFLETARIVATVRREYHKALTLKDDQGVPILDGDGRLQFIEDIDNLYFLSFVAMLLQKVTRDKTGGPGLTEDEAMMLISQRKATDMLEDWGWLPKPDEVAPEGEADSEEIPTTGGASSLISASTTTGAEPI